MGFRLLLCSVALFLSTVAAEETAPPEAKAEISGHDKMLALLQEVAAQDLIANPYLGHQEIEVAKKRLAALPDIDIKLPERMLFNNAVGRGLLRVGKTEEAIGYFLNSYRILEQKRKFIPLKEQLRLPFEIATAYLRLGENINCALRHTEDSCLFPIEGKGIHVDKEPSRKALPYLNEVMKTAQPNSWMHVKARWLANIAYMTLGEYPDGVPEGILIDPAAFVSDEAFPRFYDIAPALGMDSFDLSGGAIAEDFDGDGFLDVMVSTSDSSGPMHYYHNDGNGKFSDRTAQAGLTGMLGGLNMVQADYDNDGDVDLLVLRGGWFEEYGRHPNSLLRNNGDETFTDVTFAAGLGEKHYPTQTGAWGDYDNDGDLDLYIGNETYRNVLARCQLFRNNGNGTFTDVAKAAGVDRKAYAKAVVWGDYDNDRYPDLFVSVNNTPNKLFHNNRDGTFTDVIPTLGIGDPVASFPAWFWDYDNDGALDLFVAAYGAARRAPPDVGFVAASYLDLPNIAEFPKLYKGNGKGKFTDVSEAQGLTMANLPMGSNFGDLDGDGFLDFYLGTGMPTYETLTPNVMYRNRRGKGFADISAAGGFGHLQKGHGVVFADLDNDGDQDVYEQMGGAFPGDGYGNALYENPGFGNRWLKVTLRGVRSNRAGIGARIRVDIVEDGRTRSIYKHVNSGGSFGGNPVMRQEIGLGQATKIKKLEVYWPTSDTTQTFRNVEPDQWIEVQEDKDEFRRIPLKKISFAKKGDAKENQHQHHH